MLTKSLRVDLGDLAQRTEVDQFRIESLKRGEALDWKSDRRIREELGSLQVVGKERRIGKRRTMDAEGVMRELRGPCCLGKRDVVNVAQVLSERSHAGRRVLAMQTNEDERNRMEANRQRSRCGERWRLSFVVDGSGGVRRRSHCT